jgi:hypothetical protein
MKPADIVKVFAASVVSQVIAFLNAVFQPFEGTIFVFNGWQSIASRSAVAIGFVIVLAVTTLVMKSNREISSKAIITNLIVFGMLLGSCAGIYVMLASGYAPSGTFLFFVRDIVWMIVYILMLVMVGVTVALSCLKLFGGPNSGQIAIGTAQQTAAKPRRPRQTKS